MKNILSSVLFCTLLLLSTQQSLQITYIKRYLERDLAFSAQNVTSRGTIRFDAITRGRFGYSFIAISNSNTSFSNAVIFMLYLKAPYTEVFNRYNGQNGDFYLSNTTNSNTDNIFHSFVANDNLPGIGNIVDDLFVSFRVNATNFLRRFGTKFTVFVGVNKYNSPSSPSSFVPKLDDAYLFNYDLTVRETKPLTGSPLLRYELFHLAIYVLSLIFYIFIFIILIIFAKVQPLYSRSATPFLSTIINFLLLGGGLLSFIFTLTQFQQYCLLYNLWEAPLSLSLTILYLLHYARYIILVNVGKTKIQFTQSKEKKSLQIPVFLRILKSMGYWYSNVIILVFLITLIVIINIAAMATILYDCAYDWIPYIYIVYYVILGISFLALFIADFIVNWDTIKTCNLFKFWKEDIYYFRVEIFTGFIFVYGFFVTNSILLRAGVLERSPIARGILYSIGFHLLFFFQTIFPLILTIFKFIFTCGKKQPQKDDILLCLEDKRGREIFYEFAKAEYSLENVLCYEDIKRYDLEMDNVVKKQIAKEIYDTYLAINSQLEINCPRSSCEKVFEKMSTGEVSKNLFVGIEQQLIINLSDTFSRLMFDYDYQKWETQKKLIRDSFH